MAVKHTLIPQAVWPIPVVLNFFVLGSTFEGSKIFGPAKDDLVSLEYCKAMVDLYK
jgi:hypothetical protein